MELSCVVCGNNFQRFGKKSIESAKCCSKKCLKKYYELKTNCECTECGVSFHRKESAKKRTKRNHGYFCSRICYSKWKSKNIRGSKNPNFKGVLFDGGYLIECSETERRHIHQSVVFNILQISGNPKGYCIHHRDCNPLNNNPENLVLITNSDHRWIHKQFGNATLRGFMKQEISLEQLISWSDDIERASRLLPLSVLIQKEIGIFKLGEFEETPEMDNIEPSASLNDL